MPKIPTFTSTRTITSATPSVESNIQLNLNNTPASALQPVSKYLEQSYIEEKTIEANNRSNELLNSFYEDKKDDAGNIIQKGWLTISSEAKQKNSPTEASQYYDSEVNKLYNYSKANNLKKLNNFEKKAVDRKFYATSGLLKTKVISESRINLINRNKEIDDDAWTKDTLLLKELGTSYIEQHMKNNADRINKNPAYDDGTAKQLIEAYNEKGIEFLATSMASNSPIQFKQALNEGAFDLISAEQQLKLSGVADGVIKEQKFSALLAPLDIPFDADPRDFVLANEEIAKKTFGGNENLQAIYQSLTVSERSEFEKSYLQKANQIKADRQLQILTANQIGKFEVAQKTNEIFKNFDKSQGTYTEKLQELFPNDSGIVEQLVGYNTKVGNGTANNISKFDANDDIMKLIVSDKINTAYDKFILPGETTPLSIFERVGTQLNTNDVKYLNNLLSISNEEGFKENHTKFFDFMNLFSLEVAGSSALKDLDPKRDERLSQFKYIMYSRYVQGLREGKTSDELLKAVKGNKSFIAYDLYRFIPSMDDVYKNIRDNLKGDEDLPDIPNKNKKPTKKELEDQLGRTISISEYDELTKGN